MEADRRNLGVATVRPAVHPPELVSSLQRSIEVVEASEGAMGYPYFNPDLMADLETDLLQPEALVYAPGPEGQLRLVAVEWVVRGSNSNPPGVSEPPSLLGMPMDILVPPVGFYLMHAWVWQPNPAGMFADWNPKVTCA